MQAMKERGDMTKFQEDDILVALHSDCEQAVDFIVAAKVVSARLDMSDLKHDLHEAERALRRVIDGIRRSFPSPCDQH